MSTVTFCKIFLPFIFFVENNLLSRYVADCKVKLLIYADNDERTGIGPNGCAFVSVQYRVSSQCFTTFS